MNNLIKKISKSDLIGKKARIYQSPTNFEGIAQILSVERLEASFNDDPRAFCSVKFDDNEVVYRWIILRDIIDMEI